MRRLVISDELFPKYIAPDTGSGWPASLDAYTLAAIISSFGRPMLDAASRDKNETNGLSGGAPGELERAKIATAHAIQCARQTWEALPPRQSHAPSSRHPSGFPHFRRDQR